MYSISVRTIHGDILNFKVESYQLKDSMIHFTDPRTGMPKVFPSNDCNIDGVKK
jgi:hypothetical protein